MAAVEDLSPHIGVVRACAAFGVHRARVYRVRARRCHLAGAHVQRQPRPRPPLALSVAESEAVLLTLNSERFADLAPASIYATLLDEGHYLASVRTMYRLLAASQAVRERRNQLTHPVYTKPELLATAPCQVWSWDITKLKGPSKWTCFHLYVILDIFSRYVVGWMIALREAAELAEQLIADTVVKQNIEPGTLTLHADRGTSMRSKSVAVGRSGSRQDAQPTARVRRQPILRSAVQDAQVPPRLPRAVRLDRGRTRSLPALLSLVQHRASAQRHRLHDAGGSPLWTRRRRTTTARRCLGGRFPAQPAALQTCGAAAADLAYRRLDQPAEKGTRIDDND